MTINELKKKIDMYFRKCEDDGVFPDEAGMALYLGIPRETLEEWISDDGPRSEGRRRAILDARLRRESVLVRGIYASEKSTTGKIFLSRQGSAGGLGDKANAPERPQLTVKVKISGMEDCFD